MTKDVATRVVRKRRRQRDGVEDEQGRVRVKLPDDMHVGLPDDVAVEVRRRLAAIDEALAAIAGHGESGDDGPVILEWYSRDHEHNIEAHSTAENARAEAEALLADARARAPSDGWPEQVEAIEWGLLVPHGSVHETRTWEAEKGSSFDYMAEYALVPTGASEAKDASAIRLEEERVKLRGALVDIERLTRERDAIIGAGCSPEQNALALIDHYHERTMAAERDADALREALIELMQAVDLAEFGDYDAAVSMANGLRERANELGIAPE